MAALIGEPASIAYLTSGQSWGTLLDIRTLLCSQGNAQQEEIAKPIVTSEEKARALLPFRHVHAPNTKLNDTDLLPATLDHLIGEAACSTV